MGAPRRRTCLTAAMSKKNELPKLFSFKEWLTLDDAAKHLSVLFGEEVTRADILRLALDERLTLSVDFVNHANARKGKLRPIEECVVSIFPSRVRNPKEVLDGFLKKVPYADLDRLAPEIREALNTGEMILLPAGLPYREKEFLVLDDAVGSISGVWDLPMIGGEALDVEHRYQMETGGPSVTLLTLEGAFVERGNLVCQLQADFDDNEYEAGSRISG